MTDPLSLPHVTERFLSALRKPARLLVAVSGGSDSTGLLVALAETLALGGHRDISLVAATIDHDLRAGSADEARQVAALCRTLSIPHVVRQWSGAKPRSGVPAAARQARYRLLCALAQELAADAIVTGHTADDQTETIAMRALRTAADDGVGLSGMADAVLLDRRYWLLRPLLCCRRADIRAFLDARSIGWIDDPTNSDMAYERPRIRTALATGRDASPGGQTVAIARRRLSDAAAGLLQRHATVHRHVLAQIGRHALAADADVLRHALDHLARILGGRVRGPGRDSIDRVMAFLHGGAPGRTTLGRVVFDLRRDGLYLMRENRDIPSLVVPAGETRLWDERFEISNRGDTTFSVAAAGAGNEADAAHLFPTAPLGIAKKAARVLPRISADGAVAPAQPADVEVLPVLGPHDHFLPRFDLNLANALAQLFGRPAYLPPLHDLLTENAC